ncbi:MAG TPA: TonB-dependent receptor [Rhodocyclaceae bacterium]|nr:TonB-dependent receptor [Rhodocyclaceae bacterium]
MRAILAAVLACSVSPATAENPTEALELPTLDVIGTTPLPGLGTPVRDVPANVQVFTSRDLGQQRQTNLGEYLEQNPTSVTVNSGQGNPYQSDINFRGFTASPILGTPQGISAFQDGVRINEPFGDVVNWDLLPQSAISSIQLIPGSNPAFGLNTLGGALSIYTKSGSHYPGGSVEAYGGSFGRKGGQFEYGGKREHLDYFVTANYMDDRGWAEHNPSRVRQAFGKVGWQDDRSDLDVSLTLADNHLQGTQTLPRSWLGNIREAYTYPDANRNEMSFLTLKGSHYLSDTLILGGNAYYRRYRNENVSSNVNDAWALPTDPQALNDRSVIEQQGHGLGMQLTVLGTVAGRENQFSVGASGDFGKAGFTQDSQDANFTADRGTIAASGFTRGTDALTRNAHYGVFFSDTLKLGPDWTFTASGRFNRSRVKIEDRSGTAPALNGEHTFTRFNPAAGVNFNPNDRLTLYVAANQGSRAPTPIELACADPNAPCKLPNNFLADPALKMVISRTIEGGARGSLGADASWSAAVYRTELKDDIQFIAAGAGAINAGYFQNVGKTRRQGLELAFTGKWDALSLIVRYSYTAATFETPFSVNSPNNSSADAGGNIHVRAGNRIPGIPLHNLKLRIAYDFGDRASVGVNLNYSGGIFARGDENNQDANGKIPGYTVVNADGRYVLGKGTELFGRVANLFDRRYANFGVLGENFFTGPGRSFNATAPAAEQFRGPGVPRGVWVGLRYQWL